MLGNLIPFFFSGNSLQEYIAYYNRVLGDGGTLVDPVGTQSILKMLKDNARLDNVKLLWYGGAGVKTRVSGVNTYVSKAYSIQLPANDLAQTTELSQPWQSGNIAPNEKPCLLNPSGGSRFMTHPAISFGPTEAWSLSMLINWNGLHTINAIPIGDIPGAKYLYLRVSSNNRIYLLLNGGYLFAAGTTNQIIGKTALLNVVADGLGGLKVYINGVELAAPTTGTDTRITISRDNIQDAFIKHYYRCIQSGALSASQVAAEYNTLRALIPERESVVIGSQAWTTSNLDIVCDAQGVVIPEVTDNAAWVALTTPAWCHYNNDSANGAIYGKLYNWYAVKQIDDALAATGSEWRVPTQAQFNTLATTLGGASVAGGKMKVAGTSYFASPNTGADNSSGFSTLPSGLRNEAGIFSELVSSGFMQSIDKYYLKTSYLNDDILIISQAGLEKRGFPIRIVKNL